VRFPDDPAWPDVLRTLGVDRGARLGVGGEASVYALDRNRVLRVHRTGATETGVARRKELLDELAVEAVSLPFEIPRVLELRTVLECVVSVERRLPGRPLPEVLPETRSLRRAALLSSYLDAAASLGKLRIARPWFGDLLATDAIHALTFRGYLERRAALSLAARGEHLSNADPRALARELPEPAHASLLYLDFHPDNILVEDHRVSAVVDFGGGAIAGHGSLAAVTAAAYLPDVDQPIFHAWLEAHGLVDLYTPMRRWLAAYWAFASDDSELAGWCRAVLAE
jgi:Ser/Thr protein kinase RdoA (MazF antagonist)